MRENKEYNETEKTSFIVDFYLHVKYNNITEY